MQLLLTLSCPDRPGIVAHVTEYLYGRGLNIDASDQYGDEQARRFFMRVALSGATKLGLASLEEGFQPIAKKFRMQANFYDATRPVRAAILVSKLDHCLVDVLHRTRTQRLHMDVGAIVSNHETTRALARQAKVPFHFMPVARNSKAKAEAQLQKLITDKKIELLVLARYMQILSADFVANMSARIINIHHSFLPSFKGAEPYVQAHRRGVKMIGATAHYVTAKLDEGPIIAQDVMPTRHDMTVEELMRLGWEIEQRVLARALRWHTERRVLLNGRKTVIFA